MRHGKEKQSKHITTWCGFTIDSKRHLIYSNFIKYQKFQKMGRFVKQDNRDFQSIQMSLKRVLQVRLHAISKEPSNSNDDLKNRQIMVFCSVLFAFKRTIRNRRILKKKKGHFLFLWTCAFVTKLSFLPLNQVQWIVAYCMFATMRNTSVYSSVYV